MRKTLIAMTALGALALTAPAYAQLVNGLPGPNYKGDAPIGTKAGGAISTLQAPGERAAIVGAQRNAMDAAAMQRTFGPLKTNVAMNSPVRRRLTVARNETSSTSPNAFTRDRLRLEDSSD